MTNKPDILRLCLLLRNGIEVWVEQKKGIEIATDWQLNGRGIIIVNDNYINAVDITGFFTPQTLENYHRQKRGMWECNHGSWHEKNDNCECGWQKNTWTPPVEITDEERKKSEAVKKEIREKYLK